MSNTIKFAAIGLAGAGLIAGAVFGVRRILARRAAAAGESDLDLDNIDDTDLGEPVIVAEEIVVVDEPIFSR